MPPASPLDLGKRERQIVEVLYRLEEASVADVRAELDDPPTYSAVRATLNLLVEKRVLKLRRDGKRYLYRPAGDRRRASLSALRSVLGNFFGGKPSDVVAALVDGSTGRVSAEELARAQRLIDEAAQRLEK